MAWQLLRHGLAGGAWNMGVDEALLASALRTRQASLRLYGWQGPWLSLGYGQTPDPERLAACRRAGLGVVQRVSGGGAVLHGADLTYCVAAPSELLPGDLSASYALVADGLVEGLRELGVQAHCAGSRQAERRFDCFATTGAHEIVVGPHKVCGSAQRRVRGGVLQHGSLRLEPDPPGMRQFAGLDAEASSLGELGAPADPVAVAAALVRGFERVLGERLEPRELTPEERDQASGRSARVAADPVPSSQEAL
jgi:lipoate-protein ligase A